MGTSEQDLESDVVDPASENWSDKADSDVYHAAKAGVSQAVEELARRDRQKPA